MFGGSPFLSYLARNAVPTFFLSLFVFTFSQDAVRSLVISQLYLETTEIVVYHHTRCGMVTFTNEQARKKLRDALGGDLPPGVEDEIARFDFLPIQGPEGGE